MQVAESQQQQDHEADEECHEPWAPQSPVDLHSTVHVAAQMQPPQDPDVSNLARLSVRRGVDGTWPLDDAVDKVGLYIYVVDV